MHEIHKSQIEAIFAVIFIAVALFAGLFFINNSSDSLSGDAITGKVIADETKNNINQYDRIITKYSNLHSVPPELVKAVMTQESQGDKDAISNCGSAGIMQFAYSTANSPQYQAIFDNKLTACNCVENNACVCKGTLSSASGKTPECTPANDNRFDAEKSIEAGAKLLSTHFTKYQNIPLTLIAYNAGPGVSNRILISMNSQDISWAAIKPLIADAVKNTAEYQKRGDAFTAQKVVEVTSYVEKVMEYYQNWEGPAQQSTGAGTVDVFNTVQKGVGGTTQSAAFFTDMNYNVDEYLIIKSQVLGKGAAKGLLDLVGECRSGSKELNECMAETVIEINKRPEMTDVKLTMFDGPCDERENVWSDLVEDIGGCLDFAQTDCACMLTIEKSAISKASTLSFIYPIPLKTEIEGDNTNLFIEDNTLPLSYTFNEKLSNNIITVNSADIKIFLHKKSSGFTIENDAGGLAECTPKKTTAKVCVRSEQKFPVYDQYTKKTTLKPVEYKFALQFADRIPPPPVENIEVFDSLKAEQSVIVKWDKSPDTDIGKYVVLYDESVKGVFDQSIDTLTLKKEIKSVEIDVSSVLIDNVNEPIILSSCDFDVSALVCEYAIGGSRIALQKDVLYLIETPTPYYLFIVDVQEDKKEYDFTVLAIDTFGNQINNIDSGQKLKITKAKQSIDDLPPQQISIPVLRQADLADPIASELVMEFLQPIENIDGAYLDDLEGFIVYYADASFASVESLTPIKEISMGSCPSFSCSLTVINQGLGFYAVTAVDSEGNEWRIVDTVQLQSTP